MMTKIFSVFELLNLTVFQGEEQTVGFFIIK